MSAASQAEMASAHHGAFAQPIRYLRITLCCPTSRPTISHRSTQGEDAPSALFWKGAPAHAQVPRGLVKRKDTAKRAVIIRVAAQGCAYGSSKNAAHQSNLQRDYGAAYARLNRTALRDMAFLSGRARTSVGFALLKTRGAAQFHRACTRISLWRSKYGRRPAHRRTNNSKPRVSVRLAILSSTDRPKEERTHVVHARQGYKSIQ
jgi:hypothetical protein